jgi:UDP-glucose 4-epimerase
MNFLEGFTGKRILVTGGCGYVATSLINLLKHIDCHIIRLDKKGAIFPQFNAIAQIEDIACDVRDHTIWEKVLYKTDIVFHFAAQTSIYIANENPVMDAEINISPLLNMLETCRRKSWRPVVLFSSTVTVVGVPACLPVDESFVGFPVTTYDLHKLMAENYLKYYVTQGIVCGVILRLANVYGPGPRSSSSDRGILNLMMRKALNGETLTIYGKGDYLRDYIYIEDVANAFLLSALKIDLINGQHFVIGTGKGHTVAEAINLIADRVALKTGKISRIIHIEPDSPQSPIENRNFIADSQKFFNTIGWKALCPLVDGIDATILNLLK